ncbi:MAG: hypothetical protein RBS16_03280 [Candidatus Cloacimonadales bacterium]|jgi:hypothetical protein|nr:hypothetical protein [Candidatus Cloacimonadota bacterium]MDD2649994.1 hypothetical protein [Candidatus Cloacimonadota bacterium]MDX9977036.1 hypothetical protein [Candidatus Cloacimonadales bacterium]
MKRLFVIVFIALFLTSCRLTDFLDDETLPGDSGSFNIVSEAPVYSYARSIYLDYPYLFVADGNARLTIFDIMVPWSFNSVSTVDLQSYVFDPIYDMARDSRNTLYAAMGESGFYAFKTNTPYSVEIQNYKQDVHAISVSIDEGNYYGNLLAVCGKNFWKIYEIIGAGQVFELSSQNFIYDRNYKKVFLSYPYLYLASDNEIDIYDISNPANPSLINYEPAYNFKQMQIIGNRMIVMTNTNLIFYNISNPYALVKLSSFAFNLYPTSFCFAEGNLIVAYSNKKIGHYTLTSQYNLNTISSIYLNYQVNDIKFHDGYYYLACGEYGIVNMEIIADSILMDIVYSNNLQFINNTKKRFIKT